MSHYDVKEYFDIPPEVWDAKKCEWEAKRRFVDGYGTRSHLPGLQMFMENGPKRYNGGCTHNNKWYPGEVRHLPVLAKGFKWITVPTWGWRIVKEGE